MKNDPLSEILRDLETLTAESFRKAVEERGSDLVAFGLYTDESGGTIAVGVNTAAHLKEAQASKPEFAEDYRWSIPEWASEDYDDALAGVNDALYDYMDAEEVQERYPKDRDAFFAGCAGILERLRKSAPTTLGSGFVWRLEASELDDADLEKAWMKRINAPETAAEFASWRDSF